MTNYSHELRRGTCDSCNKRVLGVEVSCSGVPVLLLCTDCDDHKLVESAFVKALYHAIFG
jgi:hypothetical protein